MPRHIDLLSAIDGAAPDDIWTVGYEGNDVNDHHTLAEALSIGKGKSKGDTAAADLASLYGL